MGGMIAETYVLQAVQNGITTIQQNASVLSDILDVLSLDQLVSAENFFGNPKTKIGIAPGFPMQTTQLPFVGVTVANSEQDMGRTPVGMSFGTKTNIDGTVSPLIGGRFNGQIKATIYTPNADLIVWLTEIVFWSLFTQMDLFTQAGMNRISVNMGDYEPSPDFFPVPTFTRGVFLSAQYSKVYATVPNVAVTSANIILSPVT